MGPIATSAEANRPPAPSGQRGPEQGNAQDFQQSLRILDVISSWQFWGSALVLALLPVAMILLALSSVLTRVGPFDRRYDGLLAAGILGVAWVASGLTLYYQRQRLAGLREGLVVQMDRATRSRVNAEKFYGLSILDALTGLYNRRFGGSRLDEEIGRVEESKNPLPLQVAAIDFDKFKNINDKYGHAAGDLALKTFSRRLQRALRACDVPIRVGGDEFLVILPECPPEKVDLVWSRIGSIVMNFEGHEIPVRYSHGLAQYQVGDTSDSLIKRADERLYQEKAKRKAAAQEDQDAKAQSQAVDPDPAAKADSLPVRRSPRIPKHVEIFLIGGDLGGKAFHEQTNTIDLSSHGVGVVSRQKLAPSQEIIIRCAETNQEAEVRVVRVIGSNTGVHAYGLEFVASPGNIWNCELPSSTEDGRNVPGSLFECSKCKERRILSISELDSGLAETSLLVRTCDHCGDETNWIKIVAAPAGEQVAEVVGPRA